MSRWKKLALAASSALMLMAVAVLAGGQSAQLRAIGTATAGLVASAAPIDAQAGGGGVTSPALGPIEVSIGPDWTLTNKLTLTGPVTVTCGPFLPGSQSNSVFVTVSEAAGHTVAHASGSFTPACDGVAHTYQVTLTAVNVPFRPGTGVASANAFACGFDPSTLQFLCQDGQASAQVRIRK